MLFPFNINYFITQPSLLMSKMMKLLFSLVELEQVDKKAVYGGDGGVE